MTGVRCRAGARARSSRLAIPARKIRAARALQLSAGMSQLTWWTVFELTIAVAIAYVGGRLIGKGIYRLLYRFALVTRTAADDRVVLRLEGPIAALTMVVLWQVATTLFDLPEPVYAFTRAVGSIGLLVAFAFAGLRLVDAAIETIAVRSQWITAHHLSQSLLPLVRRVAKVVLCVLLGVMVLSELGYSVGPLIAGLGITGIAIALAAQKTLENVFGAFAIGVDHPFHEGDLIKLDNGLVATVEQVGLRSTRLRTPDRTLVSVPNGKLADAQIEALTARDRMRFSASFHLALGASPAQIQRVIADIADAVRTHPRRAADEPQVHLVGVADAWLELEVVAWLATTSWDEFQGMRERLLLRCLEIIAAAGATLHNAPVAQAVREAPRGERHAHA